ncbi:MAG: hypothetical protein IKX74_04905 [Erysipelotrichaceae bacterium]|nr:hypothetical protein [Erysipelotrichaceae bacterium]MBO4537288.1 hypothetical protein [Erysipelotrichaceae bacterium]MBR5048958.1 hypothetical protein [Erysipelotrichaceae bacterium]
MDFNEIVKKYNNDTASAEEVQYVEETVRQARSVAKTRLKDDKHVSFGRRVKRFFIKLFVILLILAGIGAYGYIAVNNYAKENMHVTRNEADSQVMEFVRSDLGLLSNQVEISSSKRKTVVTIPLTRSYYLYEYVIVTSGRGTYYLTVDTYSELIEYAKVSK